MRPKIFCWEKTGQLKQNLLKCWFPYSHTHPTTKGSYIHTSTVVCCCCSSMQRVTQTEIPCVPEWRQTVGARSSKPGQLKRKTFHGWIPLKFKIPYAPRFIHGYHLTPPPFDHQTLLSHIQCYCFMVNFFSISSCTHTPIPNTPCVS